MKITQSEHESIKGYNRGASTCLTSVDLDGMRNRLVELGADYTARQIHEMLINEGHNLSLKTLTQWMTRREISRKKVRYKKCDS